MASTKNSRKKVQSKGLKLPTYTANILSLLLISIGAIILIQTSTLKMSSLYIPVAGQQTTQNPHQTGSKPVKLYIPQMQRILYVSDGQVESNRWTVSQAGVSYLTSSAYPGKGNTVIYGHNTRDILGGLWRVHEGDYIYVVLENGDFIKYQVTEEKEIEPTQVEILNSTDDSRLTLYTCSGFLDEARFVIIAKRA